MFIILATTAPEFPWHEALNAGSSVFITIILWLVGLLSWFGVNKIKNEYASATVKRFFTVLQHIIRHVFQEFVEPLKDKQNGKLTEEQKEEAREKAKEAILSYLGMNGLRKVAYILGFGDLDKTGLDKFIEIEIDHAVKTEKAIQNKVNPFMASVKE